MDFCSGYVDGSVDVANKVILDKSGVSELRYPRLVYAAERTGYIAVSLAASLRGTFLLRQLREPRCLPEPAAARKVGASILLVATGITSLSSLEHLDHLESAGQAAVTQVQEFVHDNVTVPLASLSRPQISSR